MCECVVVRKRKKSQPSKNQRAGNKKCEFLFFVGVAVVEAAEAAEAASCC